MAYNPEKHHRRSIRLKGFDYSSPGAYFITICTRHRECLFGEIANGEMTLNRFGKMVATHWANLAKHHPHVQLDEFTIVPNHVHGIIVLIHIESVDPLVGAGFNDPTLAKTDQWTTKPALHHPSRSHSSSLTQNGNRASNSGGDRADFGDRVLDGSEKLLAKPAPTVPLQLDAGVDDRMRNMGDRASHIGCDRAGFGDRVLDGSEQLLAKPAPTVHGISEIIRGFKTFSARRINQIRQTPGLPVWQRNYYEHIIRDESAFENIRQYIRNNPKSWTQDQLHSDNPSKW
jgi:putative transposase